MGTTRIKELFSSDIYRRIEEVIKVDQTDEQILRDEIREYVVTKDIGKRYAAILNRYWETKNKPHEGTAVWVSGFFGSGKSSFAKMLGLAIQNRTVQGESASEMFGKQTGSSEVQVLLSQMREHIPTEAVIFDVSTDRGIKSGNQTLTEITYRLLLKSLGYAEDLDLAELEITLEQKGELDRFTATYAEMFHQEWDDNKDLIALSLGEASAVMHRMFPERYATQDTWVQAAQDRADITPGRLAERCRMLMDRRRPGRNLVFVIDEVGQFVARDVQKMLDLQAIVQRLGAEGRGRFWIVVTSQEKLTELVGGLDDKRVELARLMDRFPQELQVHLEPSDISEVTSRRVLSKNATAEATLRDLYKAHSGRLAANTKLTAAVQLAPLSAEGFIDLYPMLPYQINLVIDVVSGLRTQGGATKHVGGANRTIIKLAQQLLIHDAVRLAEQEVGALVRIDQIYDLVSGNIPSEIRGKIAAIREKVAHPMAQPVAKAICLLQYVGTIHRTAENIAATLHPAVDADSVLPEVKEALRQLEAAQLVRLADGNYRIPTPAEDDWETSRLSFQPKPGDINRIHADVVKGLWEPRPSHNLLNAKTFKGGLTLNGHVIFDEDTPFHVFLEEPGEEHARQVAEARSRSQAERKAVFWVAALSDRIDRETVEVFRSKEILSRKEREAKTKVETSLVAEEKIRLRDHEGELKRLIKEALLGGDVYFRGNDRSPDEASGVVSKSAAKILGQVLPEVYHRFKEAAARISSKDLDSLMQDENLRGLPRVFTELGLLRDEKGKAVFNTESGPLKEVLDRIENKATYGETPTGRFLANEFENEPFGWTLDAVRLFVVSLLRAGKVRATSKGGVIETALSTDAKNTFPNSNLFKACSFHTKVSGTTIEDWLEAEAGFKECFGKHLPDVTNATAVATSIQKEAGKVEARLLDASTLLRTNRLPGEVAFEESINVVRSIRGGTEDDAILSFNAGHKDLKDAIKRAGELSSALTEDALKGIAQARRVLRDLWPFLEKENGLPDGLEEAAAALDDLLARETFFRSLPAIQEHAAALSQEYTKRFDAAVGDRAAAYAKALDALRQIGGWDELNEEQQRRVSQPLESRTAADVPAATSIPLLRSEISACPEHLKKAIQEMMELIEGNLLVTLPIREFFSGKVETPEQLEAGLTAFKHRVEKLLGEGKKVLVQ